MNAIWKFLTSLRLTVVCLAFGILLVWIGTVAQADEGLYVAQERYFKQWYIVGISLWGHKIPVFLPGGYLLGVTLVVNLVAAHIKRFQWTWRKAGIHLTHAGIVLMLVGQLFTDQLQRESQIRFNEGETKNFSEDSRAYELAITSDVDATKEEVVAIPTQLLATQKEIKNDKLPFTIKVKEYWANTDFPQFRAPMAGAKGAPLSDKGVAQSFDFKQQAENHTMDAKNVPTALLEFEGPQGSLGTWLAPGWAGDRAMVVALRRGYSEQAGLELGVKVANTLTAPQVIEVNGKKYTFSMRPVRSYKPFSVKLIQTTHKVYDGTKTANNPQGIPKDFQSRVLIENPETRESREVDIYMNNPLRYQGLTFYQYAMDSDELKANIGTSTLQVVRNPSWLAPYIGCIIVGIGMTWQFMYHLVGFIRKRTAQPLSA